MSPVGQLLVYLLYLYLLLLLARLVMSYVFMFARDWRPTGVVTILLEVVYSATDPPLKALRRVIPPLRLGSVAIDLSFIVLFFAVEILINVASRL